MIPGYAKMKLFLKWHEGPDLNILNFCLELVFDMIKYIKSDWNIKIKRILTKYEA